MEKFFDKLSYDDLKSIKVFYLPGGALVIGLIIFLSYYFTLYSATNEELEKIIKQKQGAEKTLKRYKATLAKEDLVVKNMSSIQSRFDAFKNQMPDQDELPTLIQRLVEFGKNRNIKMTSFTMKEGAVEDFYKEIPLKIQITGELWDTLDFIEYVQNLLRLVSFEDLMLQGRGVPASDIASVETSAGLLTTTLTARTYSFLEDAEGLSAQKKRDLVLSSH